MITTPPPTTASGDPLEPEPERQPEDQTPPAWAARLVLRNGTTIETQAQAVPIVGGPNAACVESDVLDALRFATAPTTADEALPPGWNAHTVVETLCVLEDTTLSARGKMPLDAYVLELRRYALQAMRVAVNPRRAYVVYGLIPAPVAGGEMRVDLDQQGLLLDAARAMSAARRRYCPGPAFADLRLLFEIAEQPRLLFQGAWVGTRGDDRADLVARTRAHLKAQGLLPPTSPSDEGANGAE